MTARHVLTLSIVILSTLYTLPAHGQLDLSDGGASGSWFNPDRGGEGLFVEIVNTGSVRQIAVAWFTYNKNGGQMWLTGNVPLEAAQTVAQVPVAVTGGPMFGQQYDPDLLNQTPWGVLTLNFPDCNTGLLAWDSSAGFDSGSIELTRLTALQQINCIDPPSAPQLTPGRWQSPGFCFFVSKGGQRLTTENSTCPGRLALYADVLGEDEIVGQGCYARVQIETDIPIMDMGFNAYRGTETAVGSFPSATFAKGYVHQIISDTICAALWTAKPDNP